MTKSKTTSNGNSHVSPRVRLLPTVFALLATGSAVSSAVEVTYQYYRFRPTLNNPATQTQTQISEFVFYRRGAAVDRSAITVTGGGSDPTSAEGAGKLIDGLVGSKWFSGTRQAVIFNFGTPTTLDSYNFATANDSLDRTPTQWYFEGSTDGITWVVVDNRDGGANAVPNTLYTFRGIVGIGGGTPLATISAFGTPTTQINATGPILEAQPSIVKNTLSSALKWTVADTNPATITGITLTPPGSTVLAADTLTPITPTSNGDTYYVLEATTPAGKASNSHKLRAVPGTSKTARYVRFTGTTLRDNSTLTQIGEIEFFNNGVKIPISAVENPGGDNGNNANEAAPKIIDGDYGTKWLNQNNRPLILDFGSSQSFDAYQLTTGNDASGRDPVRWTLETSDDKVTWKLAEAVNNYPMPNERRTLTGKLPLSGTTRKWTGSASNEWNAVDTNWVADGTANPALPFKTDEPVLFADGGANSEGIYIPANVTPSYVEVDNSAATPYLFFSDPSIGLTGLGGLIKRGTGQLTLQSSNSFSGSIYLLGGTLISDNDTALGARDTLNRLELGGGATLQMPFAQRTQRRLAVREGGATVEVAEGSVFTKISTTDFYGTLHKTGTGTLRLEGIGGSRAPATDDIVIDAGTVDFGTTMYNTTIPYAASTMKIIVNPMGKLVFSGQSPLGGHHTYTTNSIDQIKVSGGTFEVNSSLNYFPSGKTAATQGRLALEGGVLGGTGSFEPVVGSATDRSYISILPSATPSLITPSLVDGTGNMALNPGNMGIISEAGSVLNISRQIVGGYGIQKEGPGEMIISGNLNTFSGTGLVSPATIALGTNISAGTLTLSNTEGSATGTSPVAVAAGATVQGTGFATGVYTVAGTVAPGGSAVGTLTLGKTTLTGTYAAQFDGATADKLAVNGDLDITGATLQLSGNLTEASYVIVSNTGARTGTFATVTGLPSGYTVVYGANDITVQSGTVSGYDAYAAGLSDPSPNADIDKDGIVNLLEYVLHSSATVSSTADLPKFSRTAGGDFVFTFIQDATSTYLNPVVEYSTDLTAPSWTTFASPVVQTGVPAAGVNTVTATLPAALAGPGGKLFARLRVTQP